MQSEQRHLQATTLSEWESLPDWNPKLAAMFSRNLCWLIAPQPVLPGS